MRAVAPPTSTDTPLMLAELSDPVPGPGEVLIRVAGAGLNRADLLQRAGHYPPPPGASPILGLEVSGTVVALGAGVDASGAADARGWTVGDQVTALLAGGGYAELVAVPAAQVLPAAPLLTEASGLDLVTAGALTEAACTAWANLVDAGGLPTDAGTPGEPRPWTVLIHGGSGGVGHVAIQLAKALGHRVLTTAGSPARTQRCRDLGADVAIDHRTGRVVDEVLDATDGRGVDLILDVLGGGGLKDNVAMLATGGRLAVIGFQQGVRGELDLGALAARRASVIATTLRSRTVAEKGAVVAAVREHVWPLVADGRIRLVCEHRFVLDDADAAHTLLRDGAPFGKVVLAVDPFPAATATPTAS